MNLTILISPGIHYLAILVAAGLIGLELYLRIRYRHLLWIRIYPQVYVPDEQLGYRYRPNAEGEIRIAGIHRKFRTNNRGFHCGDFAVNKIDGICRIAMIGTSNTTGIWMNGQKENFVEMLQEKLRSAGYPVEVMNFGIDGRFRAVHEMRLIETDVAAYKPDLILIDIDIPFVYGYFRRDVYKGYVMIYNPESEFSRKWCEAQIDQVRRWVFLKYAYYASYVVRASVRYYMNRQNSALASQLMIFVEDRIQAPDVVLLPYSLKRSVETLREAIEKLAAQGCQLVIFQYSPSLYYRQVTGKYELPYVELNVPPLPHYVHDLDGHYRYEGHVEVARQFFELLTNPALGIFKSYGEGSVVPKESDATPSDEVYDAAYGNTEQLSS